MASPQVNIRLTPELDADFDRWAAELAVERGKLAKDVVTEALAARREGRATFEPSATLGPGDLIATQATLERGVMEIDRIATVWARHEADIRKQERDNQLARTHAQNEFLVDLPERITGSLNPIREEMLVMAERIEKQPRLDEIDRKQLEHSDALKANTAAIECWGKLPRTHTSYTVWEQEWSGRKIGAALFVVWLLCIGSFFVLAIILPGSWLAVRSASRLLGGGDQAVCALVNYRMSTDSCRTEFNDQQLKVVVKAKPSATSAKPSASARGRCLGQFSRICRRRGELLCA